MNTMNDLIKATKYALEKAEERRAEVEKRYNELGYVSKWEAEDFARAEAYSFLKTVLEKTLEWCEE